jgi:hypothetical protein
MLVGLVLLASCRSDSTSARKPAGTPNDPVETCERLADVCRLDGARLGVCTTPASGKGLVCMSQH